MMAFVSSRLPSISELRDYEHCALPGVCGNKARKLAAFVDARKLPSSGLVSHGGAQSNAMVALAHLCHHRGTSLTYHCKLLPSWLRSSPVGNLAVALSLGSMTLIEHRRSEDYDDACAHAASQPGFVPQGAACPDAELGVRNLAHEITNWWDCVGQRAPLHVVVPAGTGTTALFLARHLPEGVRVHAVPCVGGPKYLRDQMQRLDHVSGRIGRLPDILAPRDPVPFGSPDAALLKSWREAADAGVLVDLLYGAVAWRAMRESTELRGAGPDSLLYYNAGGHEGLASQLHRYKRAGLLARDDPSDVLATVQRASGVVLDPPPRLR